MKDIILIDCPCCFSGNRFYSLQSANYECEDCGVELKISKTKVTGEEIDRCIFCGGTYFYYEFRFLGIFSRKKPTCYVCEATYLGFPHKSGLKGYRDKTYDSIKETPEYKNWYDYWQEYIYNSAINFDKEAELQRYLDLLEKSLGKKLSPKKIAKITKLYDEREKRNKGLKKEDIKIKYFE